MRPKVLSYLALPLFLATALATTALPTMAGTIPYSPIGTVAPTDTFTANATGPLIGYFYGFSAADDDQIQMCDTTLGTCGAFVLDNQTTPVGSAVNFGTVNAGDNLIFNMDNLSTGKMLSSDPADSSDGINHAYATAYAGGYMSIPAGTFVGMEDLTIPGSDLDYNDDQFVLPTVTAVPTPEPSSFLMMGLGVIGVLGLKRRRLC